MSINQEQVLDALEILAGIGEPRWGMISHRIAKHLLDVGFAVGVAKIFHVPILQITEQGHIYLHNHRAYPLALDLGFRNEPPGGAS